MLNSIWLYSCVMWVCVLQVYVFPSEKLLDVTGMCWLESQPDLFPNFLFQRRRGRFFEWDQHKACLFMGMNPPLARELTHGPEKRRPGTNYTNEWVSEIINNHLKHADLRALEHKELNKSDHRASGWSSAGPGLHWSYSSLLLEEAAMCMTQQRSLMSLPLPPSLRLYLEHKNIFHKKSTMHTGVWNSACEQTKKKSVWMEEEFKSQCIVRMETSRWHSGAARQRAYASQTLWECLTISTEQAPV